MHNATLPNCGCRLHSLSKIQTIAFRGRSVVLRTSRSRVKFSKVESLTGSSLPAANHHPIKRGRGAQRASRWKQHIVLPKTIAGNCRKLLGRPNRARTYKSCSARVLSKSSRLACQGLLEYLAFEEREQWNSFYCTVEMEFKYYFTLQNLLRYLV